MGRSLRSFSRLAAVSPATVSRVFSGRGRVAPDTAKRIRELAQEVDFRPSAIGRVAFGGTTNSVGVLLPNLDTSFFSDIAIGIQQRLLKDDYLPVVLQIDHDGERKAVQRLIDHQVDALIIYLIDESLSSTDFASVTRQHLPTVLLGEIGSGLSSDRVTNEETEGARLAAEHLLDLGHKRFAFCAFGAGHSSSDLRCQGLREALAARGLVLRAENIAHLPYTSSPEANARHLADELRRILISPQRPTAVFAATDSLAVIAYQVARSLNLRIPEDLSVVGYANLNFATHSTPPLTTICQNGISIGATAADMVLQRLADPSTAIRTIRIPIKLVIRNSTGPCADHAICRPIERGTD